MVLQNQNTCLSQQLTELQNQYHQLECQHSRLLGESTALERVNIEECEELEKILKTALQKIDAKKVSVLYLLVYCTGIRYFNIIFVCAVYGITVRYVATDKSSEELHH